MLDTGYIPEGFSTSILTPIPKKNELSKPADFRPISISSSITKIFECLILRKTPWLLSLNSSQFVYKDNTSCKTAFFVANETAQFYKSGRSNLHMVSLEAPKAFDKLWSILQAYL